MGGNIAKYGMVGISVWRQASKTLAPDHRDELVAGHPGKVGCLVKPASLHSGVRDVRQESPSLDEAITKVPPSSHRRLCRVIQFSCPLHQVSRSQRPPTKRDNLFSANPSRAKSDCHRE